MKPLSLFFEIEKPKAKTEEDELIQEFVDEINKERVGTKYKKVSFMAIKMKLYAIKNNAFELRRYLSECRDYKNRNGSFSRRFFGGLK